MADREMTLVEHLDELRWRLLWILFAVLAAAGVGFYYADGLLELVIRPLTAYTDVDSLIFLTPSEAFFVKLILAVWAGLLAVLPFILFQVGAFVWPALERGERRLYIVLTPAVLLLFAAGMLFGYEVLLPFVLRFFLGFASPELLPQLTLGEYVSFVLRLTLPFGLIFQLPVLVFLLASLGIVNVPWLRRHRRNVLIVIVVLAALLTPPDIISQLIIAVPLLGLYELSIIIARWAIRRQ